MIVPEEPLKYPQRKKCYQKSICKILLMFAKILNLEAIHFVYILEYILVLRFHRYVNSFFVPQPVKIYKNTLSGILDRTNIA